MGLAVPAEAVTLRDLIELSKTGLSDDILIALVEAEKSVFRLTPSDVLDLKRAGLSDRLVVYLIQTPSLQAEAPPAVTPLSAQSAQVVVVERVETVVVPVYVAVETPRRSRRAGDDHQAIGDHDDRRSQKPAAPVYWGYGGKLRPDAWGQPDPPKKGGGRQASK